MSIETVSFLKKNAASLPVEEPLIITQNGKAIYVVESYEDHQRREEAIALLKFVSFARDDIAKGRLVSSEELKKRLAARKSV
ncbi:MULTISPECIES: type II toxin-antitoxin system Phd/YefM family antitoxin [Vibrio]|uniref:type II toxin-antitoxin system Phd/YefM family antitoxin n=1 Tax=Vibrio TaxID=662 RepID=UPI0004DFAF82|nr:type II toxin-antitoxin system Phd/YefM family antitoxin [Vibrio parahaemolyticus]EGQ9239431.1 type II toxin-antitoxin system Phd/YefM family antitoxin [Vibrio vulnificus]EHD1698074.1 type II toxin-antitoxin system Phd/YefM family antitoxin [Vibrio vulnificus]EKZ9225807.1 type II toxin-antitoxin system Phd/YefM family antitoxin [Vibrio vulnificus]ELC9582646.1 type II toxin-antitoxin system Phd/YefM family antitoxin [Vibrio vulnificus]MCU8149813.1 type II toxin-antitoxin system Phd/YefM fami